MFTITNRLHQSPYTCSCIFVNLANKGEMEFQLNLALAWNRCDVAREHIFREECRKGVYLFTTGHCIYFKVQTGFSAFEMLKRC